MDYARIMFALIAVGALLAAFALLARKAGAARGALAFRKKRRLQLVESLMLDPRRRAVILRCDGREHLLVLGPMSETVVDLCAREEDAAPATFPEAVLRHASPESCAIVSTSNHTGSNWSDDHQNVRPITEAA